MKVRNPFAEFGIEITNDNLNIILFLLLEGKISLQWGATCSLVDIDYRLATPIFQIS